MQPYERPEAHSQQPQYVYVETPRPRPPATRGKQDLIIFLLVLNLLATGYVFLFVWDLTNSLDPSSWLP